MRGLAIPTSPEHEAPFWDLISFDYQKEIKWIISQAIYENQHHVSVAERCLEALQRSRDGNYCQVVAGLLWET